MTLSAQVDPEAITDMIYFRRKKATVQPQPEQELVKQVQETLSSIRIEDQSGADGSRTPYDPMATTPIPVS
jgi:hypothetical protein